MVFLFFFLGILRFVMNLSITKQVFRAVINSTGMGLDLAGQFWMVVFLMLDRKLGNKLETNSFLWLTLKIFIVTKGKYFVSSVHENDAIKLVVL